MYVCVFEVSKGVLGLMIDTKGLGLFCGKVLWMFFTFRPVNPLRALSIVS